MAKPFDMCAALDMPCRASGDFDHIEFASQTYRISVRKYIDFASAKISTKAAR